MRCIFCKVNSSGSKSVEHIIPESLWNTKQILPRGVVCDKCNNYFARKIEKPFLESPAFMHLRHYEAVPNKRGRIPAIGGIIMPGHPVRVERPLEGPVAASIAVSPEAFESILRGKSTMLVLPTTGKPPDDFIVSRFLAKVAVEALAQRLLNTSGGLEYVVDEQQFDAVRNFARTGHPKSWPHYSRRIYDANRRWDDESGKNFQVVHEYDFLFTAHGELYLVLVLYGLELTINLGGPDIDGYLMWLKESGGASPLYSGKNMVPSGSGSLRQ